MLSLITNKGLGDAIYLRAVALRFYEDGNRRINIFSYWPNAFAGMPEGIEVKNPLIMAEDEPGLRYLAYCVVCPFPEGVWALNQFTMACLRMGLENVDLKLGWSIQNTELAKYVASQAAGRPIMLYQPLKKPIDHPEGRLITPHDAAFEDYLERSSGYFRIRIGHPNYLPMRRKRKGAFDLDMCGCNIQDVFDLAIISDRIFCEPCWLVVLAEATNTPFTCLFSRRADRLRYSIASNIRPSRIFHKPELATAIYDEDDAAAVAAA